MLLRFVIISQIDQDLKIEQNEIETYIHDFHKLPSIIKVRDQETEYRQVNAPLAAGYKKFNTTKRYDSSDRQYEVIRQINFNANVNGQWYLFVVTKSLDHTNELIQSIIIITLVLIILILAATLIINRIVLKKIWKPFYETLNAMRGFNLNDHETVHFTKSNVDEFFVMNKTLEDALNKAKKDYLVLKEFTENASHELQTPLAVIRSKLDILIQDEHFSETQSHTIQAAYDALQKLSKMNRSLLLLTKIENNQFSETIKNDLKKTIEEKLVQFHELWLGKNIKVETDLRKATISMNPELLDVLLNNLLSNATRHNINEGFLWIKLRENECVIRNAGSTNALEKNLLFSRFYKSGAANDQHGLGLSIVKQICEVSGIDISYEFEEKNVHAFVMKWRDE